MRVVALAVVGARTIARLWGLLNAGTCHEVGVTSESREGWERWSAVRQ
jgi:hypothetical protein